MENEKFLSSRKKIINSCKEKPFLLTFTILGCYEDLKYRFKSKLEAKKRLKELIEQEKSDIKLSGYFAEISKSVFIETKD